MDFFFAPRGVAVIGATPNPLKGGNAILKNLLSGYRGGVYPVNPRYLQIEGLPCYPSISSVSDPLDLAIIFIPAPLVPASVEECAARGVAGVMIESSGFAETGAEGSQYQSELRKMAAAKRIRIWGPNCMGLVDVKHDRIFSFMDPRARQREWIPGDVSLVVQSGLLSATFLFDIMSHGLMGVSKVCSVGNKVDVNECDLLEYFIGDPDTRVIGFYLESFADGRRFLEIRRRCTKPIVILKGGRTRKGADAALSHTASLAGNHRIISGALAQSGIIEVRDFRQLTDVCRTLAMTAPPDAPGNRVAVLTLPIPVWMPSSCTLLRAMPISASIPPIWSGRSGNPGSRPSSGRPAEGRNLFHFSSRRFVAASRSLRKSEGRLNAWLPCCVDVTGRKRSQPSAFRLGLCEDGRAFRPGS